MGACCWPTIKPVVCNTSPRQGHRDAVGGGVERHAPLAMRSAPFIKRTLARACGEKPRRADSLGATLAALCSTSARRPIAEGDAVSPASRCHLSPVVCLLQSV